MEEKISTEQTESPILANESLDESHIEKEDISQSEQQEFEDFENENNSNEEPEGNENLSEQLGPQDSENFEENECGPSNEKNSDETCENSENKVCEVLSEKVERVISDSQSIKAELSNSSSLISSIFDEVKEIHKLYQNGYAKRLSEAQKELDAYHSAESGKAFKPILSSIARIIFDYYDLIERASGSDINDDISFMFDELTELLEMNNVQMIKSQPGDKRNVLRMNIKNRIITNDKSLDQTVANSHRIGFRIENDVLIKEDVDIYIFKEAEEEQPAKGNEEQTDFPVFE